MAPRRATIGLALAIAAITFPIHDHWLDFEAARRLLASVVIGALLLFGLTRGRVHGIRGGAPLLVLCGYAALRVQGSVNEGEGVLRAAWIAALVITAFAGAQFDRFTIARAALPTGVCLAILVILQQGGLDPFGLGGPGEAVGTLGNRNAAAEVLVMVFALASWLVVIGDRERLARAAMVLTGLALGANGTRAALAGAACAALAVLVAGHRSGRRGPVQVLAIAVVLGALGALWRGGVGTAPPAAMDPPSLAATSVPSPSTIAVRLALWQGVGAMIADAPLLGHGTGQLRFCYPRFRTEDEIEASSFGRRFVTVVESAHDDPLEIAADLGALGVLGCLWFLFRALRGVDTPARSVLLALLVPALFRSPLGNAPAALLAALWIGTLARRSDPIEPRPRRHPALAMVGGALLWLSLGPLRATYEVAFWLGDQNDASLDAAIDLHPSEPRYRSLRVQARCGGLDPDGTLARRTPAEYARCRDDLQALSHLDPDNTNALYLTAQLAHGAGLADVARTAVQRILILDPHEPRAQLLAAVLLFDVGDFGASIATLYADPHPRLRAKLAETLAALARSPTVEDNPKARALFGRETAFVRAIDACSADPTAVSTTDAIAAFTDKVARDDPRAAVLRAHALLAAGNGAGAEALAVYSAALGASARRMLTPVLERLRALPAWRDALAQAGT